MRKHDKRRHAWQKDGRKDGESEERAERGGSGYSRPPLARMLRMHERMMANEFPNCRKLAEEFEVAAKTVQRDVNFMRDRMGLPIEYDKKRFGFHYTRPVNALPVLRDDGSKDGANPARHDVFRAIGEKPALGATGRGGLPVRIRFDTETARAVRSRTWHPSQTIKGVAGGGVDLTLRARDEVEIACWVLSWGSHAWVIEPPRLRARVRQMARDILGRH